MEPAAVVGLAGSDTGDLSCRGNNEDGGDGVRVVVDLESNIMTRMATLDTREAAILSMTIRVRATLRKPDAPNPDDNDYVSGKVADSMEIGVADNVEEIMMALLVLADLVKQEQGVAFLSTAGSWQLANLSYCSAHTRTSPIAGWYERRR
ncbi:hypothetical protein EKO27_g8586 [Xylaria grammica]|uniref:Uncharacterized protein n=1 Tax=Xylaria grammica TaxID=363999 RepID=A0A439CWJ7_9PEZI|nr:hypothetical protein EKO27_g8586 [Xylaria grammica]